MTTRSTAWLIPLALGLITAGTATAQDAIGQVTSLVGTARANGPSGDRALVCGDTVYAGDTVTTGLASGAGILMGDVLAKIDAASALEIGRTDAGAPDTTLARGRVRVVDARDGGAPGRLTARTTEVQVAGNDTEAYLLSEKVGPYAMFCEWDAPLALSRDAERKTLDPNQCVIAKDSEPLYFADAHETRIPVAGAACPPDLGGLALADPHFSPTDVAAGPPPERWSNMARGVEGPGRDSCEDPGSGCSGGPGGIRISEPSPALLGGGQFGGQ